MRSVFALASVASFAGLAAAQTGYGRFPCTVVNGDNTFSGQQSQCDSANLISTGNDDGVNTGNKGDFPVPTGTLACTLEEETGAYFCGIDGAVCATSADCDLGTCVGGTCQGGLNQGCAGVDENCLGYLYCNTPDFEPTPSQTCGGLGSFCQDYTLGSTANTNAENSALFNPTCATNYCQFTTGVCANRALLGEACDTDPEFQCADGLVCNAAFVCETAPVPSGGARARRSLHARRNLCPASHEACAVPGSKGFECVDTLTNIEQCGACAASGGVDCSALPGVEATGCVAGQCEIWSCAEGFSYSAEASACVAN